MPDWWTRSVVLLVGALLVYMGAGTHADADLWGHVLFGGLHLEAGGVVRTDPFAFVPTRGMWINHEWLSEVWFALLNGLGGGAALVGFKLLVLLSLLAVLVWNLRRHDLDLDRAALVIVPFFSTVVIRLGPVRPHIFTLLFFVLLLVCLRRAEEGRERWLLTVPPLFAVWVNFHGGVLAGFAVLALWSLTRLGMGIARLRRTGLSALRPWTISVAVLVAAGTAMLLNPYGGELLIFLAETATVQRPEITEWQPLEIRSIVGAVYLLQLTILGASIGLSRRDLEPAMMVPLVVVALLPLTASRHIGLFGLAAPLLAGDHMAALFGRGGGRVAAGRRWPRWLLAGVMVPLSGLLLWQSRDKFDCIKLRPGSYPVQAVKWLEAADAEPRLATFFNWGEYVIWHLGPETKVSMDGRRETVYPDSVYDDYLSFIRGRDDWYAYLDKYGADAALLEVGQPATNLLELKPDWSEAYRDSLAVIFARTGSPLMDRSVPASPDVESVSGAGSCFP